MTKRAVGAPAAKKAPAASKTTTKSKRAGKAGASPVARAKKPAKPAAAPTETPKPEEAQTPIPELTPWEAFKSRPDASLDVLCDHIVSGGHLNGFCQVRVFSYTSMLRWINDDVVRAEMYARAREDRSDILADEIVSISDESQNDTYIDAEGKERTNHEVVARSKLRVDARKWAASKLKPRVYGEKVQLDTTTNARGVTDEQLVTMLGKFGINAVIGAKAEDEDAA